MEIVAGGIFDGKAGDSGFDAGRDILSDLRGLVSETLRKIGIYRQVGCSYNFRDVREHLVAANRRIGQAARTRTRRWWLPVP